MEVTFRSGAMSDWDAPTLIFPAFQKPADRPVGLAAWLEKGGAWLKESPALEDFSGKKGEVVVAYAPGGPVKRVVLTGLGKPGDLDADVFRNAVAQALARCRDLGLDEAAVPLEGLGNLGMTPPTALAEAVMAAHMGLYAYEGYKTPEPGGRESSGPGKLVLLSEQEFDHGLVRAADLGHAAAMGLRLARDLTNMPGNKATPAYMAETAKELAETYSFKLDVHGPARIRDMGMGAFAAVFQGSHEPAQLIVMEHAPEGHEDDPPLVLAGKGVTFDTGGICLKPGGNMVPMKGDMAGAASVLGVFKAIGHLMPETRVVGVIPCADNMPDSRAYKPGDVVTSLSGQTVEIINTDAEGRLLLADALTYAGRFKPRLLVDIATLTGACVVALGNHVGAAFSPDLDLTRRVSDADKPLAEHFWPMPLLPLYARELESEVADVKNVGKREGGAVHAAKFLERFVPENTPWLHLDIAGPGYGEAKTAFCPKGGTGYGVPTLLSLVLEHDEE